MDSSVANPATAGGAEKIGSTQLLYRCAEQMGLNPSWLTENGLFAVSTSRGEQYVNSPISSLNSHASISLARDKYLTRVILGRHKLLNIPYARPKTIQQAMAFLAEHGMIIVKPVRGFGSQDIHIVTTSEELISLNISDTVSKYIFEKYIEGKELRYLVLNGNLIGVHESEYGTSVDEHRSLLRISYPEADWDPKLKSQAVRISDILGLKYAAVDFLIDQAGQAYILEVNSTPGLKWFHAPSSGPPVDVANMLLAAMITETAV